jgi:predicted acetyltransferase
MDIEIRTLEPHEWDAHVRLLSRAFGENAEPAESEISRAVTEFERTHAAYEGTTMVATGSIASLRLTIPGGEVPTAAVTAIGVLPTHRRRGLMTAIMRAEMDEIRERGREPIACLYASEGAIYQRFGYGMGVPMGTFDIDRRRSAFARPHVPRGEISMLEREEAVGILGPVYERARRRWPGMLDRPGKWWDHRLHPHAHAGETGFTEFLFAAHQSPEELDGYVVYRIQDRWGDAGPAGIVDVEELVALSPEAYASLWRYCLDTDLAAQVRGYKRPAEEPLLYLLAEPRALQLSVRDGLWLRPVDVPVALASRRYTAEGRLVLEVADGFCPWNDGRLELEGGPDGATCRPTDGDPDLSLDAATLGAAYMGGVSFDALATAGRVRGQPDAIRRADAMFGWRPGPWCAHVV